MTSSFEQLISFALKERLGYILGMPKQG
jgi:hypothetical protein